MKKFVLPVLLSGLFAAGLIACETAQVQTVPAQNKGELAGISIRPLNASVDVGDDLELVAKGLDAQGNEIPISPVWKQVSGIKYGFLQSPKGNGDKAFITGVSKGKARVGIEIQGFSLEVDVVVKNVSYMFLKNSFHVVFQGRFSKPSFENLSIPSTFNTMNKSRELSIHPCIDSRLLFQEPAKAKAARSFK